MSGETWRQQDDPLRDEMYVAEVFEVTSDGLSDENIKSLLVDGIYTKEQVATLAAAIIAQEDGKLTQYAPKIGEVGKNIIRMIDGDNG